MALVVIYLDIHSHCTPLSMSLCSTRIFVYKVSLGCFKNILNNWYLKNISLKESWFQNPDTDARKFWFDTLLLIRTASDRKHLEDGAPKIKGYLSVGLATHKPVTTVALSRCFLCKSNTTLCCVLFFVFF